MPHSRLAAAWESTRASAALLLIALLPGAVTVYLAFNAGGYFAREPAAVALVLLIVLAVRIVLASDPLAGLSRGLAVAAAALALFVLWTFVSGSWSHASGRALIESDRAVLYLVVLVLFGSVGFGPTRIAWMVRGVAIAAVVVCSVSVATRLLPGTWPIDYESIVSRLSYPITYWNALGLLAAVGLILCFGMTSSEREPRLARVLSAAAIPLLGTALLLTLSRGAILVAILGVVVFALAGHPRALVCSLIASGPTTAIAVAVAYRSDLVLANSLTRAARDQAETLAIVVALCVIGAVLARTLLLWLDDRLVRIRLAPHARRRILSAWTVAVALAVAAVAVAVDLPRQYDRFVNAETVSAGAGHTRARLTDPSSNGRVATWRVAYHQFQRTPARGTGAGTFEHVWNRDRPEALEVRDGHSLYLEVLSELGLVGLGLLLVSIMAILAGLARRIRGQHRSLYATLFAASIAWVVAAGVDWHWEMPVVTLWFFALGAAALARDGAATNRPAGNPMLGIRIAIAAACLVLALLAPARVAISQDRLRASLDAFLTGQCAVADAAARESLRAVGGRPQPYEVLAYCALADRKPALAVSKIEAAVRRDPNNWTLHYGLARFRALDGRDPRGAAREALRLNPRETITRDAVKRFSRARNAKQWRQAVVGTEILLPDL